MEANYGQLSTGVHPKRLHWAPMPLIPHFESARLISQPPTTHEVCFRQQIDEPVDPLHHVGGGQQPDLGIW